MELSLEQIRRNQISAGIAAYEKLQEQTENPMEINERLLMQILSDNKDTDYGKKYNFAGIHSIAEYQESLPITRYEDYIGYIDAMLNHNQNNIITSYNVVYFSETSGTLGGTKLLPLTDKTLEIFKIYNLAISNGVLIKKLGDSWIGGRSMRLTEAKIRTLENGIQCGPVTSRMVSDAKLHIKQLFTSPYGSNVS